VNNARLAAALGCFIALAAIAAKSTSGAQQLDTPGAVPATLSVHEFRPFGRAQAPFDAVETPTGAVLLAGRGGLLVELSSDLRTVKRTIKMDGAPNFLAATVDGSGLIHVTDGNGRIFALAGDRESLALDAETGAGALFSIAYLDDGSGIAVGEFGAVVRKPAGVSAWAALALNWQSLLPDLAAEFGDVAPHLYRVCNTGDRGAIAVGEYGAVVEFGAGEPRASRAGHDTLFACTTLPDRSVLVAGQSGSMWRRGATDTAWQRMESPLSGDIFDLAADSGDLLVVSDNALTRASVHGSRLSVAATTRVASPWLLRALKVQDKLLLVGQHGYGLVDDASDMAGQHADTSSSVTASARPTDR
jgi:photosystem II stability/assembly factor-like uncharacterized protein